jgi:hypothetical protein
MSWPPPHAMPCRRPSRIFSILRIKLTPPASSRRTTLDVAGLTDRVVQILGLSRTAREAPLPSWRSPPPRTGRNFFGPIVKWITFARAWPGHTALTGWREPISISGAGKAAWRYTAPTALFFCGRRLPVRGGVKVDKLLDRLPKPPLPICPRQPGAVQKSLLYSWTPVMSPSCETTNNRADLSGRLVSEMQLSTRENVLTRSTDPCA